MQIFILPVSKDFQPDSQHKRYPKHNDDYGVEQDFYNYLLRHKSTIVTSKPERADWHYLPIFWRRYQLNHDYGREGLMQLQKEVDRVIIDAHKTFTIYEYDGQPKIDLMNTTVLFVSRTVDHGLDVPLLCSPHKVPFIYKIPLVKPQKKHLASFVGRLSNHPIRQEMAKQLKGVYDVSISDGNYGNRFFVEKILHSYITLCPRGVGGGSYRFYEAMQLGSVPFLIGDIDTRPFKKFIAWEEVSFFTSSVSELRDILLSANKTELMIMGKKAAQLWKEALTYQRWCRYLIQELEELRQQKILASSATPFENGRSVTKKRDKHGKISS